MWYKGDFDNHTVGATTKRVADYKSDKNVWQGIDIVPDTNVELSVRYITDSGKSRSTTCHYVDNEFVSWNGKVLNVREWSITIYKMVEGRY